MFGNRVRREERVLVAPSSDLIISMPSWISHMRRFYRLPVIIFLGRGVIECAIIMSIY